MFCVEFVGVSKRGFGPSEFEASNVRQFLAWARSADEEERAEAAVTLAWAYRYIVDAEELQFDLELCIATMLDDASPNVRRALAAAIAGIEHAPRRIIIALADDRPDVASLVLARSPVFTEAELVQYARTGEDLVQLAIARRVDLSPAVAAVLAQQGGADAVAALVKNLHVRLPPAILRLVSERFSADRAIRDAMFERSDLPAFLRCDLFEAAVADGAAFLPGSDFSPARIEKMARAAIERRIIGASSVCGPDELHDLVRRLRAKGALTITLLMRALMSGDRPFFEAAAAELSGLEVRHVAALARAPMGAAFAALIRRAGFPGYCLAPLRASLLVLKGLGLVNRGHILRPVAADVIAYCETLPALEIGALLALLRSLEKEAALDDARAFSQDIAMELSEWRAEENNRPESLDMPCHMELLERLNLLEMSAVPVAMAS